MQTKLQTIKAMKKAIQKFIPYSNDIRDELGDFVVSDEDKKNGSPRAGDMIAINSDNEKDKWLVSEQFFHDNYEIVEDKNEIGEDENLTIAIKSGFTFGKAIELLKHGHKVARKGWNGKGMFLILVKGSENIRPYHGTPYSMVTSFVGKETISILPHIDMYSAQGDMVCGWLASQTDMLSEDWEIVD